MLAAGCLKCNSYAAQLLDIALGLQAQTHAANSLDYRRSDAQWLVPARTRRGRVHPRSTFPFRPSSTRARFSREGLPHTMQCPFLLSLTTSQLAHNTACCSGIRLRGTKTLTADDMAHS